MKILAAKKILKVNDQLAAENRAKLDAAGVFGVNLVGSPGAGKTTLLEAIFAQFKDRLRMAVIEGDIAGTIDAQRMETIGVPVLQINTEGACHLDASMIGSAIGEMDLKALDLLVVENVGNLVCTAGYDLGERLRIIVLSTSEGDDKAIKYPAIFQGSDALFITKMDLAPYLNFDVARITADMKRLAPHAPIFLVSAQTGDGIAEAAQWLAEKIRSKKSSMD
ncbi:MAG: hydrogenase nickel incorporation protein HypB [Thermoguttaceae bacterium]